MDYLARLLASGRSSQPPGEDFENEALNREVFESLGFGTSLPAPAGRMPAVTYQSPKQSRRELSRQIGSAARRLGQDECQSCIDATRRLLAGSHFNAQNLELCLHYLARLTGVQREQLCQAVEKRLEAGTTSILDEVFRAVSADGVARKSPGSPRLPTSDGLPGESRMDLALRQAVLFNSTVGYQRVGLVLTAAQTCHVEAQQRKNADTLDRRCTTAGLESEGGLPCTGRVRGVWSRSKRKIDPVSGGLMYGKYTGFDSVQGLIFTRTHPTVHLGREGIVRSVEQMSSSSLSASAKHALLARSIAACNLLPNMVGAGAGACMHLGLAARGVVSPSVATFSPKYHLRSAAVAAAMLMVNPLELVLPEVSVAVLRAHRW